MRNLIALALFATSIPALAQEEGGLDDPAPAEDAAAARRRARGGSDEVVREIVRGTYLESSIGSTIFAPVQGVQLGGVMAVGIGIGADLIDQERFSAGVEVELAQGLFNGPPSFEQAKAAGPVVQGDIHTVGGTVAGEASVYLSRRFSIGGRAGGGILYAPILVNTGKNGGRNAYDEMRSEWGANAAFHNGVIPMALAGATIEYYTKLSHFSIGGNADLNVLITSPSVGVSVRPVGYLKYTF